VDHAQHGLSARLCVLHAHSHPTPPLQGFGCEPHIRWPRLRHFRRRRNNFLLRLHLLDEQELQAPSAFQRLLRRPRLLPHQPRPGAPRCGLPRLSHRPLPNRRRLREDHLPQVHRGLRAARAADGGVAGDGGREQHGHGHRFPHLRPRHAHGQHIHEEGHHRGAAGQNQPPFLLPFLRLHRWSLCNASLATLYIPLHCGAFLLC